MGLVVESRPLLAVRAVFNPLNMGYREAEDAGGDVTPPEYSASEVGDVGTLVVEVTFNEQVQSADFSNGVTIQVNAVTQTISSAVLQGGNTVVHYTISGVVNSTDMDVNDAVTWAYDDDFGDIQDLANNDLLDVLAQSAVNYIGSHLYFDIDDCSIWLQIA